MEMEESVMMSYVPIKTRIYAFLLDCLILRKSLKTVFGAEI